MGHKLVRFFAKHPVEFNVMTAIKLAHKKIECAQEKLKQHKDSADYLVYLAKSLEMIEDIFNELGVDPSTVLNSYPEDKSINSTQIQ